ncbi:conserved hypothetical protein [Ricinus communis]|uniref:Uncharacterized protein n=1 Tax=Ricinus communis TaxID=3988 RepID=B9SEK0_RICCO|nr:conserved hypothetical protein [Ricinus communis]
MMMSMFSSFDALCAESSGQKLKFSVGSAIQDGNKATAPANSMKKKSGTDGERSVSPPENVKGSSQPPQQERRRPRFAPEFDGVHCFETILPY